MTIKVGDTVKTTKGTPLVVMKVYPDGVVARGISPTLYHMSNLVWCPTANIVVPEPPKARAGVLYRSSGGGLAVGRKDGKVAMIYNGYLTFTGLEFDPLRFTEVEV